MYNTITSFEMFEADYIADQHNESVSEFMLEIRT